jgi:phosphohistidine phosphatase
MKRLTLLRHAKSDWSLPDQADWDRALNKRGQRDAPEMARRLRERKLKPGLMVSSPAVRALTTATMVARKLKVPATCVLQDERLYLASPKDILQVIQATPRDVEHLMVVGHNPGMTELANLLSAGERIDNLPTCGYFTAVFKIADWIDLGAEGGREAIFDYPKNPA